jgi:hypothetical protein
LWIPKKLVAAGRKMTRCARPAWRKRGVVRRDCIRSKVERANRRAGPLRKNLRTIGERVRKHYEDRRGLRDLGGGRPRYLKKLQLEGTGSVIKTYGQTTGLEIAKRIAGSPVGLQKIRDWTL